MGWWSIGDDLLCGDAPLDAYGKALVGIADRYRESVKRPPQLSEMVAAFDASDTSEPSVAYRALEAAIAEPAPALSKRPPKLRTGELIAIPYDGPRAIVAIVLFGEELCGKRPEKGVAKGPGLGPCIVALDLEPAAVERDVDRARTAPWLLRPFHPGLRTEAPRLGRVELTPDASFLPCFAWYASPGSSSRSQAPSSGRERRVFDYFDRDVTGRPGVESRVVPASVGGAISLLVAVRAARGLNRTLPWFDLDLPPGADRTPLAGFAPFRSVATPKPRAKRRASIEPADEEVRSFAAGALAAARRTVAEAFHDAADRPPTREEILHAFMLALIAAAEDVVADPTRLEALALRPAPASLAAPSAPLTFEVTTAHGRDLVKVRSGSTWWTVYPFREGETLVAETLLAPDDAIDGVREALVAWRAARGLRAEAERVLMRPMDRGVAVTIEA